MSSSRSPYADTITALFGIDLADPDVRKASVAIRDVETVARRVELVWGSGYGIAPVSEGYYRRLMESCGKVFGTGVNAVAAYVAVTNNSTYRTFVEQAFSSDGAPDSFSESALHNILHSFSFGNTRSLDWQMMLDVVIAYTANNMKVGLHSMDNSRAIALWQEFGGERIVQAFGMHLEGFDRGDIRTSFAHGIDRETMKAAALT